LVTTFTTQNERASRKGGHIKRDENVFPKPDRVFGCVGKGIKGSIVEFRIGLEANIGLEMDYETPVMKAWVFSPSFESFEEGDGSLFLLSLGDRSAVLQLSTDAGEVTELGKESTNFDLAHRTIVACEVGDYIVQVTEQSIVVRFGAKS